MDQDDEFDDHVNIHLSQSQSRSMSGIWLIFSLIVIVTTAIIVIIITIAIIVTIITIAIIVIAIIVIINIIILVIISTSANPNRAAYQEGGGTCRSGSSAWSPPARAPANASAPSAANVLALILLFLFFGIVKTASI